MYQIPIGSQDGRIGCDIDVLVVVDLNHCPLVAPARAGLEEEDLSSDIAVVGGLEEFVSYRRDTVCGAAVDGLPDLSELLTVVVQRADVYAERGRDLLERQAFISQVLDLLEVKRCDARSPVRSPGHPDARSLVQPSPGKATAVLSYSVSITTAPRAFAARRARYGLRSKWMAKGIQLFLMGRKRSERWTDETSGERRLGIGMLQHQRQPPPYLNSRALQTLALRHRKRR